MNLTLTNKNQVELNTPFLSEEERMERILRKIDIFRSWQKYHKIEYYLEKPEDVVISKDTV